MNRAKALREAFGKTLRDVESETGITRSSLQRIEAEIGETSYYSIERLANYYRVSIDYLMMHDTSNTRNGLSDEARKAVEARMEIHRLMSQLTTQASNEQLKPLTTKARLPKRRNKTKNDSDPNVKHRERFQIKAKS